MPRINPRIATRPVIMQHAMCKTEEINYSLYYRQPPVLQMQLLQALMHGLSESTIFLGRNKQMHWPIANSSIQG